MPAVQRLRLTLAEAPGTLPALLVVAVIVRFASDQGGAPALVWYPGGLVLVGALAVCAIALPPRLADRPAAVRLAVGLLFAYAVWSALSITWAHDPAAAWDGANRTFLYLVIFALLAGWRQRPATAATVLGLWTLAIGVVALITLLQLEGASAIARVLDARLADPSGYPNATAATFLMAFWPALALATRPELPPWLRGLFAGAATLTAETALVTQSRGATYSLPVVVIAYFVLVPGRARSLLTLLPIGAGVGLTAAHTLHASDRVQHVHTGAPLATIPGPLLLAAAVVALVILAAASIERRRPLEPQFAARGRRAVGIAAAALIGVGLLAGLFAVGDPVARARSAWHSFRHAPEPDTSQTGRLSGQLGSQRYDFYRVGIDQFAAHPLRGIGADNFGQEYLVARHSYESPHYPHSIELGVLSETGLVGASLALGAVISALVAAAGAIRRRVGVAGPGDTLGPVVAAAAAVGFASWAAHGSFDWFWEFPALGGAAWMLLGLAAALAPTRTATGPVGRGHPLLQIGVVIGCAVLAISFLLPYQADRQVQVAQRVAPADPGRAVRALRRAASLNPLANTAQLNAASIYVQLGPPAPALALLAAAVGRDGSDAYAWLIRGAVQSSQGDRTAAVTSLQRATTLNPRDPIAGQALIDARAGRRLNPVDVYRNVAAHATR